MTTTSNDDKDNDEVNYENNNEDNYERVSRFLNDIQQKSVGSQTRTKECIKAWIQQLIRHMMVWQSFC